MARRRANSTRNEAAGAGDPLSRLELAGCVVLAAIVAWWAWRAFHDPLARDAGLAYDAGRAAWSSGHPERLATWNGMPFLAASLAVIGRVLSRTTTADVITALDVILPVGAIAIALHRLRGRLPRLGWWIAALALVSFAPLMSATWWKQFNNIALVLAIAGFELARRRRSGWAALCIGLSVSIKPLAFLLPLVLLARRDSRRIGLLSIAWIAGLDVAAQALYAWRGSDASLLNPYLGVHNLIHRTTEAGNIFLCHPLNFSPTSLLCRLNGGFQHWTIQRIAIAGLVAIVGLWVIGALRGRAALSWEVLAFTAPLSVMLGALSWPHYQVMLAPLFLLLFAGFLLEGAEPGDWVGLAVAFALASLMLMPYGTLYSEIRGLPAPDPLRPTFLEQYAQFAQYVLVFTGIIWYRRGPRPAR